MSMLRQSDTSLKHITSMDKNSDMLDIDSNRYCAISHLATSLAMHTSVIILNNSILGMPSDELNKMFSYLWRRFGFDKQVIVVQRTNNLDNTKLDEADVQATHGFHLATWKHNP